MHKQRQSSNFICIHSDDDADTIILLYLHRYSIISFVYFFVFKHKQHHTIGYPHLTTKQKKNSSVQNTRLDNSNVENPRYVGCASDHIKARWSYPCKRHVGMWEMEAQIHAFLTSALYGKLHTSAALPQRGGGGAHATIA
jgi:hypothetical protein